MPKCTETSVSMTVGSIARVETVLPNHTLRSTDNHLIRRVNQLYHEQMHASFDCEHRCRHRVEKAFWQRVVRHVLKERDGLERWESAKARKTSPKRKQGLESGRVGEWESEKVGRWKSEKAEKAKGLMVVDLACGTGFVIEILSDRLGQADRLIAIDLGEANLKAAARKCVSQSRSDLRRPPLEKLAGDALALPLAASSVDLVAVNAALHHILDPLAGLREIDRILKPGGYFALGFEPNRTHFASPTMVGLSRSLDRISWYASPRQNYRRLYSLVTSSRAIEKPDEAILIATINDKLMRDGLIAEPLSTTRILDLVDPHARGTNNLVGFEPAELLREVMSGYQVHLLFSSDYLGGSVRRLPNVRRVVDAMFRTIFPRHGSLFSWLIRKPASCGSEGG